MHSFNRFCITYVIAAVKLISDDETWEGFYEILTSAATRSSSIMVKPLEMKPEERVDIAISMSDVVVQIIVDSIRYRNPRASKKEIIAEARRRISFGRAVHFEV